MKASEDLHQLIKSMSMSEKRYFKIYSSLHTIGEMNNYARLFDAVEKQEVYSEQEIREKFKGEKFIGRLPFEKHYLYQQVLESLNSFNKDKTFLARYSNMLVSIEILYNRGLFAQCIKRIKKAKSEVYKLERFSMLLILLRWETIIHIRNEDDRSLDKSLEEELRVLEVIKVQTVLMRIAFQVQVKAEKGTVPVEFVKEKEKELNRHYPPAPEADSFWAKYYYFSGIALLASLHNKHKERYRCYTEIKDLMERSPQFIKDLPNIYHLNLNNLVNLMFFLGKNRDAENMITQQREFFNTYMVRHDTLSRMVFMNTYESELYLCYRTGRSESGATIVKTIESEVKKIDPAFSPVLFDLLFMMAISELMAGNHKAATRWLNRILNSEQASNIRKELQANVRLLYLLVLFETNDQLLENRIKSTRRFLRQNDHGGLALLILDSIQVLAEDPSGKKNRAILLKHAALIEKESKRSNERWMNKQFDFAGWFKDRIN